MVRIRLFGGVSVETDAGQPIDVGTARTQAVLAALALSPGSALPVPRLVDLVWGDAPPRTAEKTLQWHMAQLRKGLGPDAIARTGAAYRLDVEPDAVDVARFQRHLGAGDVRAALAEWTAPPLVGVDAPGLAATVDGLVERWLSAVEVDLEQRIETDPLAAIGRLTELTAHYPLREGLWALLMTALYRAGRQADALEAFHSVRRHLIEQLGIEPGLRLRQLESQILDHDERLGGRSAATAARPDRPTGTVTFGFVAVDDPTRLWATESEKTPAALAQLGGLVRGTAEQHGGYLFSVGGESFGVAFHRADDAAAWAPRLQVAVAGEPWPGDVELGIRIGLHTGETEEQASGYYGAAVHVAARIAAAGHRGQTLASAVTAGLLDRADLRDLGPSYLDGPVDARHLFQVGDGVHPPLRMAGGCRGNLPYDVRRIIGRADELGAIGEALDRSPVVSLVGPGGIGKTMLAVAAARMIAGNRTGEAWLVDLAEITAAADVPRVVADVLGVRQRPGSNLLGSIVTALRSRPALLVVDNCEHVIDAAAQLVRSLAAACPDVRVLATSRERLAVDGEQVLTVGPLDPTGAGVELFNERALAADRTFDPPAHRDEVEEICRRLDGIPLAIELAAARTRSLPPADLVARLDNRLRLLTGGRRTPTPRHRTMRATIEWSYDLLIPAEQTLFQRLSIFAGPFDLAAAESVGAGGALDTADVDDHVAALVERSMLIVESGPRHRRFRLLEAMRQFAAEHLGRSGHTDLVAQRHARWCLGQVTDIRGLLAGPAEIEGVARLVELWPNLRAAVDWAGERGDRGLADGLVRPVVSELALRGRHEVGDWAERIVAMTPPTDRALTAFWYLWAAERWTQNADHDGYERLVHRHGEPDQALCHYARAYLSGDGETLRKHLPAAMASLRDQGEDFWAQFLELMSAGTLLGLGRFADVDASVSALADRYRTQGPPTLLHWTLQTLGYCAAFQGRHEQAEGLLEQSVGIEIPSRTLSANKPIEARVAFRHGHQSRAFQILRSYIDDLFDADNVVAASVVAIEFVTMMSAIGSFAEAAHMLGYLEATNDFGARAATTVLAGAASTVAANAGPALGTWRASGSQLDDRAALLYMRDVLDRS